MAVGVLSTRDALGGPWAANLRGWLALLLPATLVVILQEANSGYPSFALVLLSALAQHLVAGIVVFCAAGVIRRRTSRIPLAASLAIWISIGISRGIVGGLMAASLAGAEPQFPARIMVWVGVAVIWMPAFVFTAAQLDHRRLLLAEHLHQSRLLTQQRMRGSESAAAWGDGVILVLRNSVGPVIDEIRMSLTALAPRLSTDAMKSMSERLARLSDDAEKLVNDVSNGTRPAAGNSPPRVTWSQALRFTQRRPWLALLVGAAAMAAVLLPTAYAAHRPPLAFDVALAIAASVAVMAIAILANRLLPLRRRPAGLPRVALVYLAAGLGGSTVLAVTSLVHDDLFRVTLALIWPAIVLTAAVLVPVTTGVAGANSVLVGQIQRIVSERHSLDEHYESRDKQAREHLSAVLHGPLHGRLAACAMALSFLSTEEVEADREQMAFVTNAVIEHLASASADLEKLSYGSEA